MTLKEYAEEVNISEKDIMLICKKLDLSVKSLNDELTDDDIVMLDIEISQNENNLSEELKSKYELEDRAEEILKGTSLNVEEKKQKLKKKESKNNTEFKKEKKDIYKHKEKLQSNKLEQKEDTIIYKEGMSVKDLAVLLEVDTEELVKKLFLMGLVINANQSINYFDAEVVTLEYGKKLIKEENTDISNFEEYVITDEASELKNRPPVVTVMGHVDHGKTTLLDYIRNTHVASKEAGGITQSIGAYQVDINGKKITFIDTPGHEAFTEMRARGASITDIVIIIVAVDDGIMPQTKEAIEHAKSAKVPIIVALNKIDKDKKNLDKLMANLSEYGLTPEEWGGDTIFVKISALTGEGVDKLLENIIALSDIMDLKANPNRYSIGTVIDAKMDKNTGITVSLLIQNGTLRLGDPIVVGTTYGKVRTLKDSNKENLVSALPSMPVTITGLSTLPIAGDKFMSFETEKEARNVATKRSIDAKNKRFIKNTLSLEDLFDSIKKGKKEINIVLKTDTKGSEEAVKNSLTNIKVEDVKINIIRSDVGAITTSDVLLANTSDAIIIGFNVVPFLKAKEVAKQYNVDIRMYNVIYKLVEEIEKAMKGMLDPTYEEVEVGEAEVRQLFKFSKVGIIAGSHVINGIIKNKSNVRLIRDGVVMYEGKINTLQREKNEVKEVRNGFDCGITLENYSDIKVKDIISTFEMKEVKNI